MTPKSLRKCTRDVIWGFSWSLLMPPEYLIIEMHWLQAMCWHSVISPTASKVPITVLVLEISTDTDLWQYTIAGTLPDIENVPICGNVPATVLCRRSICYSLRRYAVAGELPAIGTMSEWRHVVMPRPSFRYRACTPPPRFHISFFACQHRHLQTWSPRLETHTKINVVTSDRFIMLAIQI